MVKYARKQGSEVFKDRIKNEIVPALDIATRIKEFLPKENFE